MKEKKFIPEYLRGKHQLIATVFVAAVFAILFLLGTIPFSTKAWFRLGRSFYFPFTLTFIGVSAFVVVASNFIMYKTRRLVDLTYFWYVLWRMAEIVLVTSLYTTFAGVLARPDGMGVPMIFFRAFCYAFVCIGIPYIVMDMYFVILDQRMMIRGHSIMDLMDDDYPKHESGQNYSIYDATGTLKLSVNSASLLYIEADDNYVRVRYEDHTGTLQSFLIRCPLKTIEDSFAGTSLVRCHRKYIVNMDKVKVLRKEMNGYELDLDYETLPHIPVTKTYAARVLERFSGKN